MRRIAGPPLLVFLILFIAFYGVSGHDGFTRSAVSSEWTEEFYSILGKNRNLKSRKKVNLKSFASYSQSFCSACRKVDELSATLKALLRNTGSNEQFQYFEETSEETYGLINLRKLLNKLKVQRFLQNYQKELAIRSRRYMLVSWEKNVNLTEYNIQKHIKAKLELSSWEKKKQQYAVKNLTLSGLSCSQSKMLKSVRRTAEIEEESRRKESVRLSAKIEKIYSDAKVCNGSECLPYEPGLMAIFAKSRDYDTLLWAWKGWRDAIGPKIRNDWIRRNELDNLGAHKNGYNDLGAFWRSSYHVDNFQEMIDDLWKELEPLYKQLHAYVRHRLHKVYGNKVSLTGPIPAHLLGHMWAQQWGTIYDLCVPYKDAGEYNVHDGMKKLNYTVDKIFRVADDFYQSIGLPPMPDSFWEKSMFVRPPNRSVVCYASASNLGKTDVRVKMCASANSGYLYVAHHEMGHCQYYLAYNQYQPTLFQNGANNGFHEAIGDTAALSVINPTHLLKLGLIEEDKDPGNAKKKHINFLMHSAMDKLAFHPSALAVDKWRWKVFSGEIPPDKLNTGWWEEKIKLGGVAAPIARTEKDFDPGSKYHIANKVPYIRELLQAGSSKHWEDILYNMTGSCKISVKPVKKYFQPLLTWLVEENKRLGNKIGWE